MKENFVKYIEGSIRDHWDLSAFSDYQAKALSYGEVAERILRLHALFKESGLPRGAKVGLLGRNSSNWAITYLAVVTYGATIVPILPDFHPSDFENIVAHSDSVFLFTTEIFLSKIDRSRLGDLKAVFSLTDFSLLFEKAGADMRGSMTRASALFESSYRSRLAPATLSFDPVPNEDLAAIVYTSGTTGFSKGVMMTHANIISNLVYAQDNVILKSGDTILSFLPLAHTFGNAFEFVFPFSRGCHITFLGRMPTTSLLIEAFAAIKPRMVLSVPLVIEKIYYKQIRPCSNRPKC